MVYMGKRPNIKHLLNIFKKFNKWYIMIGSIKIKKILR